MEVGCLCFRLAHWHSQSDTIGTYYGLFVSFLKFVKKKYTPAENVCLKLVPQNTVKEYWLHEVYIYASEKLSHCDKLHTDWEALMILLQLQAALKED